MFIGHFGTAFAAKPAAKKTSLGTLFLAAQFIDLLWPTLLLLGLESVRIAPGATQITPLEFTHYPISHSLAAVLGWSVLFGAVYFMNIFGPPPPSVEAVAWTAQALWLVVALAYWIDRYRELRAPAP